ncbi:MAG: HAMP domain-containing protein, partial [Anaerolineae bacterium]|nr:HAMP domain-containing protein [Anaerolineae bacterium]
MTLRTKTLAIIGATLLGLIGILYVASQSILVGSFSELETYDTQQNVERALSALSDTLLAMDSTVYDWATWDDTYAFIEDLNPEYIESNVLDSTFTGLQINFLLLANNEGKIVFGQGFDLEEKAAIPVPPALEAYFKTSRVLLDHDASLDSRVMGVIPLEDHPLLVASRPILTSEGEGPSHGALIMGRYLNTAELQRLGEITRLSLTLYRFNDPYMPADFVQARAALAEGQSVAVQPLNAQTIAGYALLEDVSDQPILILRVDLPRNIWYQGQNSIAYFLASLVIVGAVFGVITLMLLERLVLARLARLDAEVGYIGASGSFDARVSVVGGDELAHLAHTINHMLIALKQSQSALLEAHNELERRVQARTLELAQANETLRNEI